MAESSESPAVSYALRIAKSQYDEAFKEEHDFIKDTFGNKYDGGLQEMIDYAGQMGFLTKHPGTGKPLNSQAA